jgi:hypothetical protein
VKSTSLLLNEMDETEQILSVLAEFVPSEVLDLCNVLEERVQHLGFFDTRKNCCGQTDRRHTRKVPNMSPLSTVYSLDICNTDV